MTIIFRNVEPPLLARAGEIAASYLRVHWDEKPGVHNGVAYTAQGRTWYAYRTKAGAVVVRLQCSP